MYYLKHDTILLSPFCFSGTEMQFTTGYKWSVRSTENGRTTFCLWYCCSKRQKQIPLIMTKVSKWTPMVWKAVS